MSNFSLTTNQIEIKTIFSSFHDTELSQPWCDIRLWHNVYRHTRSTSSGWYGLFRTCGRAT